MLLCVNALIVWIFPFFWLLMTTTTVKSTFTDSDRKVKCAFKYSVFFLAPTLWALRPAFRRWVSHVCGDILYPLFAELEVVSEGSSSLASCCAVSLFLCFNYEYERATEHSTGLSWQVDGLVKETRACPVDVGLSCTQRRFHNFLLPWNFEERFCWMQSIKTKIYFYIPAFTNMLIQWKQ